MDMAAGFDALSDHRIGPGGFCSKCLLDRTYLIEHPASGGLSFRDGAWDDIPEIHHGVNLYLQAGSKFLVEKLWVRRRRNQVHPEWLVGTLPHGCNFTGNQTRWLAHHSETAEASRT